MKQLNNRNSYSGARQGSTDTKDLSAVFTHLARRGACLAVVAACIACVPQARAVSFTDATFSIVINPRAVKGIVASGVRSDSFKCGIGFDSHPSSLQFIGAKFLSIFPEQTFSLDNLSNFHGTRLEGTHAFPAGLQTKLAFRSPVARGVEQQRLTKNVDFSDYTQKMGFESAMGGRFSDISKFSVPEAQSARANLTGIVTACTPPSVPETGSTLALMAMAVAGLGGLRQYVTSKI